MSPGSRCGGMRPDKQLEGCWGFGFHVLRLLVSKGSSFVVLLLLDLLDLNMASVLGCGRLLGHPIAGAFANA